MSGLAALLVPLLLAGAPGHAAAAPAKPAPLSQDARRVAFGLFFDTPVPDATIERSLDVLSALRCRYGLHGGVRDDEEAARRALEEVESLEFNPDDRAGMAERLGVSLAPAQCGAACEQFERMVLLRLRMAALQTIAAGAVCGDARTEPVAYTPPAEGPTCREPAHPR